MKFTMNIARASLFLFMASGISLGAGFSMHSEEFRRQMEEAANGNPSIYDFPAQPPMEVETVTIVPEQVVIEEETVTVLESNECGLIVQYMTPGAVGEPCETTQDFVDELNLSAEQMRVYSALMANLDLVGRAQTAH